MTRSGVQKRKKHRKRPLVWVKQLALFESLNPLVEIRKPIQFGMGLNIIQGEFKESSDAFETGHGIGKTTVCRLLRYCLGEKTFGQNHVAEEVRNCFPTSYVGAVIEVDGVEWSVLRSLRQRGKDYAKQQTPLSELVDADDPKNYSTLTEELERVAFDGIPKREVLSNGHSIQWLHLLAMCSRDQESRYDRFWNWRHSRSESSTPKFAKPKVDASLCVRAILGLLDPDEPKLRTKLERLEESSPQIRAQIKEKELEPSLQITRLRTTLTNEFGVEDATDAPIDQDQLFGVSQAADQRLQSLHDEVAEISKQLTPLDRQISLAAASLLERSEMSDQQSAASEVTTDGNDALLHNLENTKQRIEDRKFTLCPGGGLVGDCNNVQARIAVLDQQLTEQRSKTVREVSDREQVASELAAQAKRQQAPIEQLQARLDELNDQKNEFLERRLALNNLISRLPSVSGELRKWNNILNGTESNSDLTSLMKEEKATGKKIEKAKKKLNEVIAQQNERAKQFRKDFNNIVQRTINPEFKGEFIVEEDGVNFRISRGNSLYGEAYETLAVLLADIALLAESSRPGVNHPGFLVHDSPREADLNVHIYERLLDVAASMMQDTSDGDDVPYQYIVTTTTPPSTALRRKATTKLKLSSGNGSLFGRQLEGANSESDPTLFDGKDQS